MSTTEGKPPLNIIEAFKERHSIRVFNGQELTEQQQKLVAKCIEEANQLETPFHTPGIELSLSHPGLGLLGVTTKEFGWIVEKIPSKQLQPLNNTTEQKPIIDASYIGEHVVMKLAQYHIDTIWIANTYNQKEAERRFPGFKVPSAIAYGIKHTNQQIHGKYRFFGWAPGERLPFEQIFYDEINKKTITEKDLETTPGKPSKYPSYFKAFLTSLRSTPSAQNIQPWRFVFTKKEVHLFDINVNHYSHFDMGIALASLHLLAEIRGGSCKFKVKNPPPPPSPLKGTYIMTAVYNQ